MASYNVRDIDRVCRASGMSRARADALLRQYDGRPDRVLEEMCGAKRVYIEPESVSEKESRLCAAWRGAADLLGAAWRRVARAGRRIAFSGILPALLAALLFRMCF